MVLWTCPKCKRTFVTTKEWLKTWSMNLERSFLIRKCPGGCNLDAQMTFISSPYHTTLRGRPDDANRILREKGISGVGYMPKLNVAVEVYPDQVTEPGTYRILAVKGPQDTRQGRALIMTVSDTGGKQLSLFVPFKDTTSSRTNLYRLMKGLGDDTDKWIGKSVKVSLNEQGKRTIEPVR